MYWLVEDKEQLEVLTRIGYKEAFIEVIPYNDTIHPTQNHISLLYIRPILASKGFMVCIHHSEALNVLSTYKTKIINLLNKFEKLYCYDKKETLHYLPLKALYDINPPPTTYIRPTTQTHEIYYSKHKDNPSLNLIIPIVKHYERCETLFGDLKANINREKTKYDEFFNSKTTMVFNAIERSGIRVYVPTFEEYFHPLKGEYVYTQFNLKTTTTRPSNSFKNVNYAALNKENGCRKSFIPRNNKFVDFDVKSMHVIILSKLIGYKLPPGDIYEYLGEIYGLKREEAKILTLKQINSSTLNEYENLEFFKKISLYKNRLWEKFGRMGYVECPVSGYFIKKEDVGDMNPGKLLNYLLQCLETSIQVKILWELFRGLKGFETKIVLYVYDSILLDLKDSEKNKVLSLIRDVYTKYGFDLNYKEGNDYHSLVSP